MNAFENCPPRAYEAGLHWKAVVSRLRIAHTPRAAAHVLMSLGGYVALWMLMARLDLWQALLLTVPAAWLLVRVFFILHDCRSGAFFYTRAANRVTGFVSGMLTFTPFTECRWGRGKNGSPRAWAQEVEEWLLKHGVEKRRAVRVVRQTTLRWIAVPLVMIAGLQRIAPPRAGFRERSAVWLMNAALAVMMAAMILWLGWQRYLVLQIIVLAVAAATGVAVYRAQREFEEPYWRRECDGEVPAASLRSFAWYRLPRAAHSVLGGLGFHRLHDVRGRVPGYHLRRCHAYHPVYRMVRGRSLRASSTLAMSGIVRWLRQEMKGAAAAAKTASGQMRAVNDAARLAAAHRRAAEVRLAADLRQAAARRRAAEPATMTAPQRPVAV